MALIVVGVFAADLIAQADANVVQIGSDPGTPLYILGGVFALLGAGWLVVEAISARR